MSKVMLITGASRGIGAATARLAAGQGYRVIVNYQRNREAAEALVESIITLGGEALAVQADVADEAQVRRLFANIDERLGRLDVLVNNAGMLEQQMRLERMSLERWQRVFATNVYGSFLCSREAIARMSTRQGGRAARRARGIHRLRRGQGRGRQHDGGPGQGTRRRWHPRQRRAPWSDRHRDSCQRRRATTGGARGGQHSTGARRARRRGGRGHHMAGGRAGFLHHRLTTGRQRRSLNASSATTGACRRCKSAGVTLTPSSASIASQLVSRRTRANSSTACG